MGAGMDEAGTADDGYTVGPRAEQGRGAVGARRAIGWREAGERSDDAKQTRMSPPVLAVYNQKGGAGKSVSTANLARALAGRELRRRVLVLELDKQANCSLMLGVNPGEYDAPMTRAFEGAPLADCVVEID